MASANELQSHRFVVVFRREAREIEGASEVWRGWIERVPAPGEPAPNEAGANRIGFGELAELPALIRTLIDRAARPDAASAQGRQKE